MSSPADFGKLRGEYGCRFAVGAAANRESPEEGFGGGTGSMGRL